MYSVESGTHYALVAKQVGLPDGGRCLIAQLMRPSDGSENYGCKSPLTNDASENSVVCVIRCLRLIWLQVLTISLDDISINLVENDGQAEDRWFSSAS